MDQSLKLRGNLSEKEGRKALVKTVKNYTSPRSSYRFRHAVQALRIYLYEYFLCLSAYHVHTWCPCRIKLLGLELWSAIEYHVNARKELDFVMAAAYTHGTSFLLVPLPQHTPPCPSRLTAIDSPASLISQVLIKLSSYFNISSSLFTIPFLDSIYSHININICISTHIYTQS